MEIIKIVSKYLDSNTFVVKNKSKALIIDAGAEVSDVLAAVGKCDVCGIFLTHAHFDHILNLDKYLQDLNVRVFASCYAKELFYNTRLNYGEGFILECDDGNFRYLKQEEKINVSGFEIECLNLPGHSKCSMIYLIDGHMFTGDVLFDKGIGRTDLLTGNKSQMLESLKKICTLDFSEVHSGHGCSSTYSSQQRNLATYIKFLSR